MGLIGGLVSTVLGITSILLPPNQVCTMTNTVTKSLTQPAIASQVLSITVTPTETVYEYITVTVDTFETSFIDEEYIDIGSLTTDSVGYEVIEEFESTYTVQTDTLYSGEVSVDTTNYITSKTLYTTSTTTITVPTLAYILESTTNTITINRTFTSTRYHFHDELYVPGELETSYFVNTTSTCYVTQTILTS